MVEDLGFLSRAVVSCEIVWFDETNVCFEELPC